METWIFIMVLAAVLLLQIVLLTRKSETDNRLEESERRLRDELRNTRQELNDALKEMNLTLT